MKTILVKKWIYQDLQTKAGKYNFTLVWEKCEAETMNLLFDINEEAFFLYGNIEKETEKAIMFSLDYWNLNKAGRYITDAPRCNGFKVWIPKIAIYQKPQL